jgi:hypothetical protein
VQCAWNGHWRQETDQIRIDESYLYNYINKKRITLTELVGCIFNKEIIQEFIIQFLKQKIYIGSDGY